MKAPTTLTAQYLVATFTAQDHLDTHGLDLSAEEVHRRAGAHRRNVVSLKVVDHIWNRVEALLHSEGIFVVHSAQIVCRFPRRQEVGRVLQADGERVQLGPGRDGLCNPPHDVQCE